MSTSSPDRPTTNQSARDRLLDAAQQLFWEQGVGATSPREVLERSGVGQGSLYHHFPTKADLALSATEATAAHVLDLARVELVGEADAVDRLRAYLERPRDALAGCRIGRLTGDQAVMDDASLQVPVHDYFATLVDLLDDVLVEAGTAADDARDRAFTAAAVLQGGYVLARGLGDPTAMDRAVRGFLDLLTASPRDAPTVAPSTTHTNDQNPAGGTR